MLNNAISNAIIICGPTCSGKTEFAHKLAKKIGGEIINADSMQVYKQIPIITSSPSKFLKTEINYHLYNHIDISEGYSVIKYVKSAADKIKRVITEGSIPIIVGGSGLYIKTLVEGYSPIPDISKEVKSYVFGLFEKLSLEQIWDILVSKDPQALQKIKRVDKQRIGRALEVIEQTGKSIFEFVDNQYVPLPHFKFNTFFLLPERSYLYDNCHQRTEMIIDDAIIEIDKYKKDLERAPLASKALGIREILSYLGGAIDYRQLIDLINLNTRHYAKRQITWFKNQVIDKQTLEFKNQEEFLMILNEVLRGGIGR